MAVSSFKSYSTMKFTLNNGVDMPAVGFGTFRITKAEDIMRAVNDALGAGYRMFDTAAVYRNEVLLGEALATYLPKYGLEREDIFVTTKLSTSDHGTADIIDRAYRKSLNNLGLDYVDLYLIHFPGSAKIPANDPKNQKMRYLTWSALQELYDDGRVNAIGVSNFTVKHLKEILYKDNINPAVNQVEYHPYYNQRELLEFCKNSQIQMQAYCSFGGTSAADNSLLEDPVVKKIAKKLNVTAAQLLLVWALQQEVAVIPKSTNTQRIKENISLNFKIPEDDMKELHALGDCNVKYAWDPNNVA